MKGEKVPVEVQAADFDSLTTELHETKFAIQSALVYLRRQPV